MSKKFLGIELGSTRIKAVVIDERGETLASGSFVWENKPLYLTHTPQAHLTRANIIRAELKAVFATLATGMEILRAEGVYPKSLVGHGGLFKTPGVAETILSETLGIPVTTRATAGEGGAWGIAMLAAGLA